MFILYFVITDILCTYTNNLRANQFETEKTTTYMLHDEPTMNSTENINAESFNSVKMSIHYEKHESMSHLPLKKRFVATHIEQGISQPENDFPLDLTVKKTKEDTININPSTSADADRYLPYNTFTDPTECSASNNMNENTEHDFFTQTTASTPFDTTLLKTTIHHMDINKCNFQKKKIQNNVVKEVYADILFSFWNVFYGHYAEDDQHENNRFHIKYDDDMFFMKSNIFMPEHTLINDIINFVNIIEKLNKYSNTIDIFYEKNTENVHIDTSYNVLPSNFADIKNSFLNEHKNINHDKLANFFYVLKNEDDQEIDGEDRHKLRCYLLNNADTFFEMLYVEQKYFKSINNEYISIIYKNQLNILFNNELEYKLLLFPEYMALYEYYDRFNPNTFKSHHKRNKLIGYYIFFKFEMFIKYLKKLLPTDTLNINMLYTKHILFCKVYVAELYFTYLFGIILHLNPYIISRYAFLNRLLLLSGPKSSRDSIYLCISNMIEFILFNFINIDFVFYDILIYNYGHLNREILQRNLISLVLNDKDKLARTITSFTNNMSIFNNLALDDIARKILDNTKSACLSATEKNTIQEWITAIKMRLIQKIKNNQWCG